MSKTFVMLKPDAVERNIIGNIIAKIEAAQYKILHIKSFTLTNKIIHDMYSHHYGKPFFDNLVNYMTRGTVVGLIVEGDDVVNGIRELIGSTNCIEAALGTIRNEFCNHSHENTIHSSDSNEAVKKEIAIFFGNEYI